VKNSIFIWGFMIELSCSLELGSLTFRLSIHAYSYMLLLPDMSEPMIATIRVFK